MHPARLAYARTWGNGVGDYLLRYRTSNRKNWKRVRVTQDKSETRKPLDRNRAELEFTKSGLFQKMRNGEALPQ